MRPFDRKPERRFRRVIVLDVSVFVFVATTIIGIVALISM